MLHVEITCMKSTQNKLLKSPRKHICKKCLTNEKKMACKGFPAPELGNYTSQDDIFLITHAKPYGICKVRIILACKRDT